jgi:hypothetical protein
MLEKPLIQNPTDEMFIYIFFQGGNDNDRYGFVTDGTMSIDDWRSVLIHNGFLSPYSIFNAKDQRQWKAHGMHKAVIAAQSLGHPTGGSIMGRAKTDADLKNVYSAYQNDIGIKITHFFHDVEDDIGTPGGNGDWRLRVSANNDGAYYQTRPSSEFDTSHGQIMRSLNYHLAYMLANMYLVDRTRLWGVQMGGKLNSRILVVVKDITTSYSVQVMVIQQNLLNSRLNGRNYGTK